MLNPWRLSLLHQLHSLGTVRAVAQAASMSPSSVSQQLAVLETETRTQLLERVGRRVRLTPAGEILAARAGTILDLMHSVEDEMSGLTTTPAGPVRLACFPSAMRTLVIPAARILNSRYPLIDLRISELEPPASTGAVDRGECDIAVTAAFSGRSTALSGATERIALASDDVVLVLPQDGRTDGAPADLADFAGQRWSLDLPNTYLAELTLYSCRQAGFEPVVAGQFGSIEGLLRHVEAGLSVALLPRLAVDDRYRVSIRTLTVPPQRDIAAVVRAGTRRMAVECTLDALQRASSDR